MGRSLRAICVSFVPAAILASGCQLPGREGPVPKSLATSRQLSRQGVAAVERGQLQEAESLLAGAVKACPVDPEARCHFAEALWQRGARQQATAQMEEACRLVEGDAVLRARLAEMHLAIGQMEHARRNAERALDLNPRLSSAWAIRGRVMRAAAQHEQALADFHRALGYAPEDRQVQLDVAEVYRDLNQPQRALAALQSLAETYSPGEEPQQVLQLTGLAHIALGRYDEAVESLSAAAARGQPTPEILYGLGEAQLLAGRPAEAVAAARQALALCPEHAASRELLSRIELARRPQAPPQR